MEDIEIKFETITPIYTGNAYGEMEEIKPLSIMGSLRFWFDIYCKSKGIGVYDYEDEPEKLEYDKFKKYLILNDDISIILNNKDCKISLTSQIFGCQNWKSRIKILNISDVNYCKIEHKTYDYDYLFNEEQDQNTRWWSNKILFQGSKGLKFINGFKLKLSISKYYFEHFLSYLTFFKDKYILIGGKKSFGFGFCKMNCDLLNDRKSNFQSDYVIYDEIQIKSNSKILGYNFKFFSRKKEREKFRVKNFGKRTYGSNYYFSNTVEDKVHIIAFPNGNKSQAERNIKKYKRIIKSKLKEYNND